MKVSLNFRKKCISFACLWIEAVEEHISILSKITPKYIFFKKSHRQTLEFIKVFLALFFFGKSRAAAHNSSEVIQYLLHDIMKMLPIQRRYFHPEL